MAQTRAFKFHDEGWESKLRQRDDCRVVPMPDPAVVAAWKHSGSKGEDKPRGIGHWLMLREPKTVNEEMEAWLAAGD